MKSNKALARITKAFAMAAIFSGLAISPVFAAEAAGPTPQRITLDFAITKALEGTGNVIKANNDLEKAKIDKKSAQSSGDDYYKSVGKPGYDQLDQTEYKLVVYGPVMADFALQIAEKSQEATIASTKLNVINKYYAVAASGKNENACMDALKKSEKQYSTVQTKYKLGMVAKLDVLNAEIQLDNAKIALESARNKTVQGKRSLCVAMGLSVNTDIGLGSSLEYVKLALGDSTKEVSKLVTTSPVVAIDELSYKMAEYDYEYSQRYQHKGTYGAASALKTFETAKAQYETTKNQTIATAYQTVESLIMAEKQYQIAMKGKKINEELYRLAVLRFENGMATQTDVLAASSDLATTDNQLIGALLQYNVAKTALEQGLISGGMGGGMSE